jgi:hypothetical protein
VEFNLAESSVSTDGAQAWINAVLVLASFGDWAIIVNQTLILEAFNMRISSPLAWTFADRSVSHGFTNGSSSTWPLGLAGINTLVLDTSSVVWTFLVKVTFALFDWFARGKGITLCTGRTSTSWPVV